MNRTVMIRPVKIRAVMKRRAVSGVAGGVLLALAPVTAHAAVVAEWKMDEAAGASTMVDSATGVGGANNGTITNVTTGVTALVSGRAYKFGGGTSHVKVPDNASLDPGTKNVTLGATVRIANVNMLDDSYDIVRKGVTTTSGGYWKMEVKRAADPTVGNLNCVFKLVKSDGSIVTMTKLAPVDVADGRTHTLRCIRSATKVQAVVDGTAYSRTAPAGSISNNQPVFVGSKSPGDDVLQGVLDQVTVSIG
jgi:hypothetical protein